MEFKLNITCNNAAFTDESALDNERDDAAAARGQVALILRDAAKHIENGSDSRRLMDVNGNHVGQFAFSD